MNLGKQCSIALGRDIKNVKFSTNLSKLLRLPPNSIDHSLRGSGEIGTLTNRPRQLFLLSDMVQATTHCDQRLPILCDFLHRSSSSKGLNEKRFMPMSYVPVSKLRVDSTHIQLADEMFQPVKTNDTKTLITLYFQKSKRG